MSGCSAYGCTNRPSKKVPGITYHSFPKDEQRRKQWMIAARRKNWTPSKCSKLCSKHFPEEMIDRTSLSCVRLRENAVPTIFDFSSSYSEDEDETCEPSSIITNESGPSDHTVKNSTNTSGTCSISYLIDTIKSSAGNATKIVMIGGAANMYCAQKRKIEELEKALEAEKKKVEILQQETKRYQETMSSVSYLLSSIGTQNIDRQ